MKTDDLRRQAQAHGREGRWDSACTVLFELLRQVPQDVAARMELASALLHLGRLRDATRELLNAVPQLPRDTELISQLCWRLSAVGETGAARYCVSLLETAPNPPAHVLADQGQLRWTLGDIALAKQHMVRALRAGADMPGDFYVTALLAQFTGDRHEAERLLLEALGRWSEQGDCAVALVNLRPQRADSNHLAMLRRMLEAATATDANPSVRLLRAKLKYALFKTLDDLGRFDEAWPALAASNALMSEMTPYDRAAEASLVDGLIDMKLPGTQAPGRSVYAEEDPTPIFIVGMPRSGTTLLDHMLSAHSEVISAGEISDFQRQLRWVADVAPSGRQTLSKVLEKVGGIDWAELGSRYIEQTRWRARGRRFFIDKLPINIQMVPFIRRALPHAPILHMVREPMDVCYSNLKVMFGQASGYCYDMTALAHYHGQYVRLANHWRRSFPGAMLDVHYNALVGAPEKTLGRVLAHCALPFEEACLHPERNTAPVATPSSGQVREPIHTRSIGEWKRYAEQLEPLRRALAEQPGHTLQA